MMTSLFSPFDPTTILYTQLNWSSTSITILLLPLPFWLGSSQLHLTWKKIHFSIHLEMKTLLGKKSMGSTMFMTVILIIILMNNLMGLFPYIFTSSSHMIFSLSLSLPLWLSFMMFGWLKNTNKKFAHLVPEGTPTMLMPFTVMIETLSNMIRPCVVSLRLMINMMAGHFLISLLGSKLYMMEKYFLPLMMAAQLLMIMFEAMVSCIQAYVFTILISLYFEE